MKPLVFQSLLYGKLVVICIKMMPVFVVFRIFANRINNQTNDDNKYNNEKT